MEEVWKDIKNYEGIYQISSLGRIRSLDRYVNGKYGQDVFKKGIIRKFIQDKDGYCRIILKYNGIGNTYYIHRLIAEAFIPNPLNLPIINHKDENPNNNNIDNLEWCTYQYNNTYNNIREKSATTYKKNHKNGKYISSNPQISIVQLSRQNEYIDIWFSIMDIQRSLSIKSGHISEACRNVRPTAGGYKWMYLSDYELYQNSKQGDI